MYNVKWLILVYDLDDFCRLYADEFARDNIQVNCIAPGPVVTKMTSVVRDMLI